MGKHRKPSNTGKKIAAFTTAMAIPGLAGLATAPAANAEDLDQIAKCESNGSYTAQNPGSSASGKYQMIDSTFRAYGGSTEHAKDASPAEQDRVAARLFAAEGTSPWDASSGCWSGKHSSKAEKPKAEVKSETVSKKKATPEKKVVKKTAPKTSDSYTVKSGDTLSGIAAVTGSSWQKLYEKNDDTLSSPHRIFVGQTLDI